MESNGSEPLLSSNVPKTSSNSVLISSAKWVLRILMWAIFVAWVFIIFAYPSEFGGQLFEKWNHATSNTVFGITGSIFLLLSGPVILIAILAVAYAMLSGNEDFHQRKSLKHAKVRLWTFPVLVDGPLGVVSATEFIGIVLFVVYVLWALYVYTLRNLSLINKFEIPSKEESIFLLELTGLRLGMIGLFCLVFLFLPISRGSVLLRLIDIPFEHATRYHVWLGHLTMLLFTLHGLFYVIGWAMRGELIRELLEWREIGIANLAGVISLFAGLLMWVTSLRPVRRWNFELFFYTHQLYVVFVVFLAFHVGDFIFSISAGAIFLFILDRFLRFCQSRKTVDVLSVKSLPCGTVELVLSKPASLKYNALSFIFLQVRELSWLQWHPFSVSSSPLDGKHHLAVLIKVLGGWTAKLKENIEKICEADSQNGLSRLDIAASVEGPYGHESPYHLMYENLILVAGGIGISPFLAILRDILHRLNEGKPCLPKNILIVWAIKKTDELPLLSVSDLETICPYISDKLNLDIQIYVTRESEPNLEEGRILGATTSSSCPISKACPMSVLAGTGDNIWSGLYIVASFIGFVIMLYASQVLYVNPFHVSSWWYKGLLFMVCMVASVVIFGGAVIVLWQLWERRISTEEHETNQTTVDTLQLNGGLPSYKDSNKKRGNLTTIHYGSRPDFREIFDPVRKSWGDVDIGVLICGPPTLQSSVAREIRSQNLLRETSQPVFHYNSHSFDL